MAGMFGGSSAPALPKVETIVAPDKSSSEIQSLAEEQRKRLYASGSGRANAMLTGGQGASTTGVSKAVRMLGSSPGSY